MSRTLRLFVAAAATALVVGPLAGFAVPAIGATGQPPAPKTWSIGHIGGGTPAAPPLPTGPISTVPASIPHDCSVPVESQIKSWLVTLPPGSIARFEPHGCYGVDETITVDNPTGLTIDGNGSTFKALTLQTSDPNRAVWRFNDGSGVTLADLTVRGANDGRWPTPSNDMEWQHGVVFNGTHDAVVENASILDVYGDFIEAEYGSAGYAAGFTRNLLVDNVHMEIGRASCR